MSLAGAVMDTVAALLNDTAKQIYTYTVQMPYLKIALRDFAEIAELHNVPVTNKVSTTLTVPLNTVLIGFATSPALPSDLVDIRDLWVSSQSTGPFTPMSKRDFLDHGLDGTASAGNSIWSWGNSGIQLLPNNIINYIKLDYISTLFSAVTDQNSDLGVINADSFLHYRTAALCAEFIGENKTRADNLNGHSQLAIDRLLGIETKSRQGIAIRKKSFRSGYKSRNW